VVAVVIVIVPMLDHDHDHDDEQGLPLRFSVPARPGWGDADVFAILANDRPGPSAPRRTSLDGTATIRV
jgi:hypothetical protein